VCLFSSTKKHYHQDSLTTKTASFASVTINNTTIPQLTNKG